MNWNQRMIQVFNSSMNAARTKAILSKRILPQVEVDAITDYLDSISAPLSASPVTGGESTAMSDLIEAICHQINGCGRGQERFLLAGVRDYAMTLLEKEKRQMQPSIGAVGGMEVKADKIKDAYDYHIKECDMNNIEPDDIFIFLEKYLSTLPTGDAEEGKEEKK